MNIDAAAAATAAAAAAAAATAAATAAAASAITTSPGSTPVAVIGLQSIGATVPNIVASNRGGSGTAQKAANANTKKGLGVSASSTPL